MVTGTIYDLLTSESQFAHRFLRPTQDEINHCAETRLCQPCIRVFDSPLLQIFSHALRHGLPLINRSDNPTFGNLEVQALTTAIVVAFADGVLPSSLRPITLVLIALP